MKYLRHVLMVLAVIVIVISGMAAYIAATFDPNDYKPQIIELVKQKQQRTLRIDGDIRLAFWPSLGADLGGLSLSEFKRDQEFAAVESARVSLALMPLLSKRLVVNEVAIRGVRANIVRFKDGRLNIDDLLTREDENQQQLRFDIDHVAIGNAALSFRDEAKGVQYALSKINLKTGRIANDMPTRVGLSLAAQSDAPLLNLDADFKTRLTFDLNKLIFILEDAELEVKGRAAGVDNLAAKVTGNLTAKLESGKFEVDKLLLAITGVKGKDHLEIKLAAPGFIFAADKASGGDVTVAARIVTPQSTTSINLSLPGIEGTAQSFKSDAMALALDIKQSDVVVSAKLSSLLAGDFQTQQLRLSGISATVNASGPHLPGKRVNGEFSGSASVDGAKQNVQSEFSGKLASSNIKARVGMTNFAAPALSFDAHIDQFDADRYLTSQTASGQTKSDQPLDLSWLKKLNASGTLRIGSLTASGVKAAKVRLDIKRDDGGGPGKP